MTNRVRGKPTTVVRPNHPLFVIRHSYFVLRHSRHSPRRENRDRWGQPLSLGGRLLDLAHRLHTVDDLPEGSEALTIGVTRAAEVELGLIADAEEEVGDRAVGDEARHRD